MRISLIAAAAAAVVVSFLGGCASGPKDQGVVHQGSAADKAALRSAEPLPAPSALLYVNGLSCPLCATNVDVQLKRIAGVKEATVDLGAGTVLIEIPGAERPSPRKLSDAVADAGFTLVRIEAR